MSDFPNPVFQSVTILDPLSPSALPPATTSELGGIIAGANTTIDGAGRMSVASPGSGPQGPQGASGTAGAQGATGPQGAAGGPGAQGATGPQGTAGVQGTTGPQGAAGAQGTQGPQGATGAQGAVGAQGTTGPQGAAGAQGTAGAQGAAGAQGTQGTQGPQGPIFLAQVTLADAATITPTLSVGNSFTLALTASGHTLENPTGGVNGQVALICINAGTAPDTMVFGTGYLFNPPFSSASPPVLGPGRNYLTIVQQGTAAFDSVLQAGTFT